jgi:outer membrane protein assembly factor BamD (BamD/ComL family)
MVAECFLNQNDYQQAKIYLMRLARTAEQNQDNEKASYLLGWIAYREEQFDEAVGHFQRL